MKIHWMIKLSYPPYYFYLYSTSNTHTHTHLVTHRQVVTVLRALTDPPVQTLVNVAVTLI